MNLCEQIWCSSLGKKYVMAMTGGVLFLFVIGHLLGNLQVFGPPELINAYAHFLKSKPGLVWGARLVLLGCVGLHIAAAVALARANRAARPVGYEGAPKPAEASMGSRTMLLSGLVILGFVVYHLAHFTVLMPGINGVGDFTKLTARVDGETVADVYGMMVLGFQVGWVVLFYLVAQGLLFMHLGHGVASMFQSLGMRDRVWWPRISQLARVASLAIFVGYAAIPAAIYMRVVGADYAEGAKFRLQSSGRLEAHLGEPAGRPLEP
jgi:succinate dehydrogenase / fumarate reductase cytochrome b subunit